MGLFDKYAQFTERYAKLQATGIDPFHMCVDRILSRCEIELHNF